MFVRVMKHKRKKKKLFLIPLVSLLFVCYLKTYFVRQELETTSALEQNTKSPLCFPTGPDAETGKVNIELDAELAHF